jgi:nickel-dependent lactate racemase
MCKPNFMLNVALNKDKQITAAFGGDVFEAHKEGCAYVKDLLGFPKSILDHQSFLHYEMFEWFQDQRCQA